MVHVWTFMSCENITFGEYINTGQIPHNLPFWWRIGRVLAEKVGFCKYWFHIRTQLNHVTIQFYLIHLFIHIKSFN